MVTDGENRMLNLLLALEWLTIVSATIAIVRVTP
jgi:hypothetical protein